MPDLTRSQLKAMRAQFCCGSHTTRSTGWWLVSITFVFLTLVSQRKGLEYQGSGLGVLWFKVTLGKLGEAFPGRSESSVQKDMWECRHLRSPLAEISQVVWGFLQKLMPLQVVCRWTLAVDRPHAPSQLSSLSRGASKV